jgi:hypothetical protein
MGHGDPIGRVGRGDRPPERIDFPRGDPGPHQQGPSNGPAGGMPVDHPNAPVPSNVPPQSAPTQTAPTSAPAVEVPQLKDGFNSGPSITQSSMLRGEGQPTLKPVTDLTANLQRINDLGELPQRFASDVAVQKQQLNVPGMTIEEQNSRVFQFFVQYAGRFVEIAQPPDQKEGQLEHGEQDGKDAERVAKLGKGEKLPGDGMPDEEGTGTQDPSAKGGVAKKGKPEEIRPEFDLPDLPEELYAGVDPKLTGNARGRSDTDEIPQFVHGNALDDASYPGLGKGQMFTIVEHDEAPPPPREYTPAEKDSAVRRFASALRDIGFEEFRDARTGKDGVQIAKDLLRSGSVEELERKFAKLDLQRTQTLEDPIPSPAITREIPAEPMRELGMSANQAAQDRAAKALDLGASNKPPMIDGLPPPKVTLEMRQLDDPKSEVRGTRQKLGKKMLWNVLHTFRRSGDDTAEEEAKWDRLTFGAVMILVLVMLAAIVLVNL